MENARQGGMPNRLIAETSPYLLQHAHNPVDWYPWGEEALARARTDDKPILLSVGYSACHWCHVMAHESFEDPEIAELMNAMFVNIKVDREERPDVDAIYMQAVQSMTGRGGWPMTVILTPDGRPFFGGTYFPPSPRYGMPSFRQLLHAVDEAWHQRRAELESAGNRMVESLRQTLALQPSDAPLSTKILDEASRTILRQLDAAEGGFGGAPKFPQPTTLDFLLQHHVSRGDPASLEAVTFTLTQMANGGIYDQLGGGFHRYSTDASWLVPHFEKMLYDNAQLALTYLHAWKVTGQPAFRRVVEETLDYILLEMTSPDGGFYSSQDADSDGKEGRYFVWTPQDVQQLIDPLSARAFMMVYDVTEQGTFPEGGAGANVLHVARDVQDVAADLGIEQERLASFLSDARSVLRNARNLRPRPGRDEKILAEWNGLAIRAYAEAGAVLNRPDYLAAAVRAATFVKDSMTYRDGAGLSRVHRSCTRREARLQGYLEDYGALGLGFLALYEATFDLAWLEDAAALAETIVTHFGDDSAGGFFQTSSDHELLIVRRKDYVDSAVPSGNSLAAELLLQLGRLLGRKAFEEQSIRVLSALAEVLSSQPLACGNLLSVLEIHLIPGPEFATVGDLHSAEIESLIREIRGRYMPGSLIAWTSPDDGRPAARIPLLMNRVAIGGHATVYVCQRGICKLPVTHPAALAKQLDELFDQGESPVYGS